MGIPRVLYFQNPLQPWLEEQMEMSGGGNINRRMKLKRRTPSPPPTRDKGNSPKSDGDANSSTPNYTTTLLVRNLSHSTRQEDLRIPFGRFGLVNDVYLPCNYYTGKPRGFGFVKYRNCKDAAEAKQHMNNQIICGHQICVVFSKEDAKSPDEMHAKELNIKS